MFSLLQIIDTLLELNVAQNTIIGEKSLSSFFRQDTNSFALGASDSSGTSHFLLRKRELQ